MQALPSYLIDVGLSLNTAATVAAFIAPWCTALELINHFRPFLAPGARLLLFLALGLGPCRLMASITVAFAVNVALLIGPAVRYGAPRDPAAEPSLRVVTLNTHG